MKMNVKETAYMRGEEAIAMSCYTNLTASQKVAFINCAMTIVLRDNYYPMLRDLAFDYALVNIFTDVYLDTYKTIDDVEALLAETNIVDIVKTYADQNLVEELRHSFDLSIEYKTGIHENQIEKSVSRLIRVAEEKLGEVKPDEMMELSNKLAQMSGDLTPERLVDAYANSEVFQNRYNEIMAQKAKPQKKRNTKSKKTVDLKVVE